MNDMKACAQGAKEQSKDLDAAAKIFDSAAPETKAFALKLFQAILVDMEDPVEALDRLEKELHRESDTELRAMMEEWREDIQSRKEAER